MGKEIQVEPLWQDWRVRSLRIGHVGFLLAWAAYRHPVEFEKRYFVPGATELRR